MVHSLSEFPITAERKYYLYVLRGSWDSELAEALKRNQKGMADHASRAGAVVLWGTEERHFENEVFSWHHLNGMDAEPLLPAILITTLHPSLFRDQHPENWSELRSTDHMLLIPLKDCCSSSNDVAELLGKIFNDIRSEKRLRDFEISERLNRGKGRAILDGLILQPNLSGIGIDLKEIAKNVFKRN